MSSGAAITTESDDMDKVLTSYFDKTTLNSNTIKEKSTPSSELSKGDLLKILSYLEGEVQARDVVIATLKCERAKRFLADNKYSLTTDPFAALKRDNFALLPTLSESKEDAELIRLWEAQKISFENLVRRQRQAIKHLNKILGDADILHSQAIAELEEEKAKNIATKDVSSLRSELEMERALRSKFEEESKESERRREDEKERQKSIVLLLLSERKKLIRRFIEEGKRSADLLLMLEEEKRQGLSIAQGLEEESQKALRMEAELERQASSFIAERERLTSLLRAEEEKKNEIETHFKLLRTENEGLRKQLAEAHSVAMFQASMNNPATTVVKKSPIGSGIVRPIATASSVPVSQPTIGIAKSVSPVQSPALVNSNHGNSNAQVKTSVGTIEKTGGVLGGKKYSLGRGVPPPVPPNKPSVPPKSGTLIAKHAAKLEQHIS